MKRTPHQRCPPILIASVHIRTGLRQHANNLNITMPAGMHQRRILPPIRRIRIRIRPRCNTEYPELFKKKSAH